MTPIIPAVLEIDTTTTPPTMQQLIQQNRALMFRLALLQDEPVRWLARYWITRNRSLRRALARAVQARGEHAERALSRAMAGD